MLYVLFNTRKKVYYISEINERTSCCSFCNVAFGEKRHTKKGLKLIIIELILDLLPTSHVFTHIPYFQFLQVLSDSEHSAHSSRIHQIFADFGGFPTLNYMQIIIFIA